MPQNQWYIYDEHPIYSLGDYGSDRYHQVNKQYFYDLRQKCLESKLLFEDPVFVASDESLLPEAKEQYEWLRPSQICDNPQFFVEGYSRFDVQQGVLGNCWFIAAVANLTLNPKLFLRVVCEDNTFDEGLYAGIFHFRFWQFGKWVDVVIDDRLPTKDKKLVYNKSTDENEFWPALLEKAYAKLHGSYEALVAGHASEAHENFSGGITEYYNLNENGDSVLNLMHILKGLEKNSMMACSISQMESDTGPIRTDEGLVKGHAYSVTKVQHVKLNGGGEILLLRLRNPWGNEVEWNGPWSDKSKEWQLIPEHEKEEIGLTFDYDGEFWMSYDDFLKHFDILEICNLSFELLTDEQIVFLKRKFSLNQFRGEWVAGVSAGGCDDPEKFYRNPQYIIHLRTPDHDSDDGKCSVVIALMQNNRKIKKEGLELLYIGFNMYSLSESDLKQKPFRKDFFERKENLTDGMTFVDLHEMSARFKLLPGYYLIVPATFDVNEEGEFLIRVFTEHESKFKEHDEAAEIGEVDSTIAVNLPDINFPSDNWLQIEKFFYDIADDRKEIGWKELKKILEFSMKESKAKFSLKQSTENKSEPPTPQKNFLQIIWDSMSYKEILEPEVDVSLINNVDPDRIQSEFVPAQDPTNVEFSKEVCRSMVAMLDYDRSGKLGMDEFKKLMFEIAKWTIVFKLYDKDHNNKLDTHELRNALESAGYRLNYRILISLLYRYGSSDKTMTIDDFIMCAVKVKTMIERFKEKDYYRRNEATFTIEEWIEQALYS